MRRLILLLFLTTILLGCGGVGNPAAPAHTERELWTEGKVQEYATTLGGIRLPVPVHFHEHKRGDGALAWADTMGLTVHFVKHFVEHTDKASLSFTVAHEVCHLKQLNEEEANECARWLISGWVR